MANCKMGQDRELGEIETFYQVLGSVLGCAAPLFQRSVTWKVQFWLATMLDPFAHVVVTFSLQWQHLAKAA